MAAYRELEDEYGADVAVAVRSSATAEDLPTASFAGQHESFLNIRGAADLFEACRQCFASIFTDRAISYRIDNGFDHFKVALSVGVMKMVRSDEASSGVIFTLDTESGFRDVVFITGVYGLGENIVQGTVDPDEFYVHKPTFREGYRAVLSRRQGASKCEWSMRKAHRIDTRNVPTSASEQERFCIDDADVLKLADYAIKIEDHYSARPAIPIRWISNGPRTARTVIFISSRRGRKPSRRAATPRPGKDMRSTGPVRCWRRAVLSARRSLPARPCDHGPAAACRFSPGRSAGRARNDARIGSR